VGPAAVFIDRGGITAARPGKDNEAHQPHSRNGLKLKEKSLMLSVSNK
jgi:hypothetical protein